MSKKRKLKNKIGFFVKPFWKLQVNKNAKIRSIYTREYKKNEVKDKTILYETRDGKSIVGSPLAMYKYMQQNDKYSDYLHIWVAESIDDKIIDNIKPYVNTNTNTKIVIRNSKAYLTWLTQAQYLITDSTFQSYFIKKEAQIYINTWHGTPLKYMGFDIPGTPAHSQNVVRNFLFTDYLISPNEHTTNIFIDAYKLNGIYEGKILEGGYPRNDCTANKANEHIVDRLTQDGVMLDQSKQTILYTPTWKGSSLNAVSNNVNQIVEEVKILNQRFENKYNILVKVHPYVFPYIKDNVVLKSHLITDYYDANEILSLADLLITDYSSIFFDFLVTDKPILFYIWDKDMYDEERGMYFDENTFPGPTAYTISELIELIEDIDTIKLTYHDKYAAAKQKFCSYETGNITKDYVEHIFEGKKKIKEVSLKNDKKRLLFYPGGMKNNGITSSFINLTNNIDYDKYEVVVFMGTPHQKEIIQNIEKVDSRAHFLFKPGLPDYTLTDIYKDQLIHNRSLTKKLEKFYPKEAYQRETRRLTAGIHFDVAIDFSGYSYYWGKYVVEADTNKRIVFMHNDLKADSEKTVGKKRPHFINLRGMFSLYKKFDRLISVSEATMRVNHEKLKNYIDDDNKIGYCINSLNIDKILYPDQKENNDEIKQESIKKINQYMRFNTDEVLPVYPYIKKLSEYNSLKASLNDEILITAVTKVDFMIFYKAIINGVYMGWIEDIYLIRENDKLLSEEAVSLYGVVSRPQNHVIWNRPFNTDNDLRRITYAKYLKSSYVHIKKVAVTNRATYYNIYQHGKELGWIDSRAVPATKKIRYNFIELIRIKFRNRNQKIGLTSMYRKIEKRGLIKLREQDSIWSEPFGTTRAKKINTEIDETLIYDLKAYAITNKGRYYLCYSKDLKIGWIDRAAVHVLLGNKVTIHDIAQLEGYSSKRQLAAPQGLLNNIEWENYLEKHSIVTGLENIKTTTRQYAYLKEILHNNENMTAPLVEEHFAVNESNFNFVNMGRLSPEKAQVDLIHAFYQVHLEHPHARLYILGEGLLRNNLESEINKLELNDYVFLMGHISDPFSFLKQCDAFVLSSYYEGQPMVLLESLTLGLPVVATNIPANNYVLKNGEYGILTEELTIDSLAKAMKKIMTEPVTYQFDAHQYNREAIANFYDIIEN